MSRLRKWLKKTFGKPPMITDLEVCKSGDYKHGGGWGSSVQFTSVDWSKVNMEKDKLSLYGFKSRKPRKGNTLSVEMHHHWLLCEFVSVEYPGDPRDMFFGEVKIIGYALKPVGERG